MEDYVMTSQEQLEAQQTSDPNPMMARVCCSSPAKVMTLNWLLAQLNPTSMHLGVYMVTFSLHETICKQFAAATRFL